jgi:hypothetical protein
MNEVMRAILQRLEKVAPEVFDTFADRERANIVKKISEDHHIPEKDLNTCWDLLVGIVPTRNIPPTLITMGNLHSMGLPFSPDKLAKILAKEFGGEA